MKIQNKIGEYYTETLEDDTITAVWSREELTSTQRRDFNILRYMALRFFMLIAGYKSLRGIK
jgi:hypothetical protein